MFRYLRHLLVYTLSFLLIYEPYSLAMSRRGQDQFREFVRVTGLAQRSMTLRELYNKTSKYLNEKDKAEFKEFLDTYEDITIPQVDIKKVTGSDGQDDIQVNLVSKDGAVSLTLTENSNYVAKIGNKKITRQDMWSFATLVKSATGQDIVFPGAMIAAEGSPKRGIASVKKEPLKILNSQQIAKLPHNLRVKYITSILELLELTEELQLQALKKKTGKKTSQLELLNQLLFAEAYAAQRCIIAGYVGEMGARGCSLNPSSQEFRTSAQRCSGPGTILCNPVIYGTYNSGDVRNGNGCVPIAGRDNLNQDTDTMSRYPATRNCNRRFDRDHLADIFASRGTTVENFDQKRAEILGDAEAIKREGCDSNPNKGEDQTKTCLDIEERITALGQYRKCAETISAPAGSALADCFGGVTPPNDDTTTSSSTSSTSTTLAPVDTTSCDYIQRNKMGIIGGADSETFEKMKGLCVGGGTYQGECGAEKTPYHYCACTRGGQPQLIVYGADGKMSGINSTCANGSGTGGTTGGGKKKSTFMKKWFPWIAALGISFLFLRFVLYPAQKAQSDSFYDLYKPQPPVPPVPPPQTTPTLPDPRSPSGAN